MIKKAQQSQASEPEPAEFFFSSTRPQSAWRHNSKKAVFITVLAVIVVGAGVGVGYYFYTQHQASTTSTQQDTSNSSNKDSQTLSGVDYDAVLKVATSDPDAAQGQLDDALNQQESNQAKAEVYSMKASLYASAQGGSNYAKALEAAKQADTINPTPSSAEIVALYARQNNNEEEAITWYETAQARLGDPETLDAYDRGDYDAYSAVIARLRSE